MRSLNPLIALGVLVAVHLAVALFAHPLFEKVVGYSPLGQIALSGILLSQVSLVGLWAAWGTEPFLIRGPRCLFLLVCIWYARLAEPWLRYWFKSWLGSWDPFLFELPFSFVVWNILPVFTITTMALIAIRLAARRKLFRESASNPASALRPTQFSLTRLFVWITAVAFLVYVGRAIFPPLPVPHDYGYGTLYPEVLNIIEVSTVIVGIPAFVIVLLPWQFSRCLMTLTVFGFALTMLEAGLTSVIRIAITGDKANLPDFGGIVFVFLAMNAFIVSSFLPSLLVVRACGYRWMSALKPQVGQAAERLPIDRTTASG